MSVSELLTYAQANEYLQSVRSLGSKPGLGNITRLCNLLGDPQDKVRCVHVAGTNGKGSTCAMTASILKAAGYKTGLFLSPHLESYRHSMSVNGESVPREEFAQVISAVKAQADAMKTEEMAPTEFELLTAAAFLWFYRSGCEFAVIETGMGGRLDATNVIQKPLVSVITAISKDHTAYLGETLREIAAEKCGIIKHGGTTVLNPMQFEEACLVIHKAAEKQENTLIVPDINEVSSGECTFLGTDCTYKGIHFHLPLCGKHQVMNAITALETVLALRGMGFAVADADIKNGMEQVHLPGRQEVLCRRPLVLIDGAHNLHGVHTLAQTMKENLTGKRTAVIMGMLKDKEYEPSIAMIAPLCGLFVAVEPANERALDADTVAALAAPYCHKTVACEDHADALHKALGYVGPDGAVVICGSLYLAGPMRRLFLEEEI